MGLQGKQRLLVRTGFNSSLILLVLLLIATLSIGASASSVSGKTSDGKSSARDASDDSDEILGLGKAAFIGICVACGVVIIGIPIACCFCCACLCFSSRKKQKPSASAKVPPSSIYTQQEQQGYERGQSETMPPNNYPGAYQQQQQTHQELHQQPYQQQLQQQLQRQHSQSIAPNSYGQPQQQQHTFGNAPNSYPPVISTAPGSVYQDSYGPKAFEPKPAQQTDPNLIVNRFSNRPAVPPKPNHKFPGWTNVTKEVKLRNQIKKDQYNAQGYDYDNDAYDGGDVPYSPTPSTANNNNSSNNMTTKDNFMY